MAFSNHLMKGNNTEDKIEKRREVNFKEHWHKLVHNSIMIKTWVCRK